jgi:hypothetical protein
VDEGVRGAPHFGQIVARGDNCCPQSGHGTSCPIEEEAVVVGKNFAGDDAPFFVSTTTSTTMLATNGSTQIKPTMSISIGPIPNMIVPLQLLVKSVRPIVISADEVVDDHGLVAGGACRCDSRKPSK